MLAVIIQLINEVLISQGVFPRFFHIQNKRHQRFRDKPAAMDAETPIFIRLITV